MNIKIKSFSKPFNLAVGAFLLPYIVVVLITIIVRLLPYDSVEQQWEHAGSISLWLPFISVILSALLIGFDTVRLNKKKSSNLRLTVIFLSTVLISGGLQFSLVFGVFMLYLYAIAGLRH